MNQYVPKVTEGGFIFNRASALAAMYELRKRIDGYVGADADGIREDVDSIVNEITNNDWPKR